MIAAENKILSIIKEHKSGKPVGITSVCSVNEYVIEAAILNAKKHSTTLLIESTSNQVDQFGGYTGMKPKDFKELVYRISDSLGFPGNNIVLGGDHLGPNVWSNKASDYAMENAREQIKAYINAGYSKIHLDTSMKCADDGDPDTALSSSIIAERAAILCKAAEEEVGKRTSQTDLPVYVIGTDVPTPGGAKKASHSLDITTPERVEETINLTREAFLKYGLENAWNRVIAVVVQPGVEFGDNEIFEYERKQASGLKKIIETKDNLIYEAHSTDFQKEESLREMVEDHFVILKVGPWLTYAFREVVFALEMIEKELYSNWKNIVLSEMTNVLELSMKKNPVYWKKYYAGNIEEEYFKRKYSLSDRIRYYWTDVQVKESFIKLLYNLSRCEIPLTLLSQFLPESYEGVRHGEIKNIPEQLIINRITKVLNKYNYATIERI